MNFLPKLKVYCQVVNKGCYPLVNPKGDLIDLRSADTVDMKCPQALVQHQENNEKVRNVVVSNAMVSLGVRMLLPHGMKANVYPRSGTYKNFGVLLANSVGQIDYTYNGPKDIWMANLVALKDCHIMGGHPVTEEEVAKLNDPAIPEKEKPTVINYYTQGDRVCQFEVVLSQFATFWDKLRWFFSSGIELVIVDNIDTVTNRGGFSTSGVK